MIIKISAHQVNGNLFYFTAFKTANL